MTSEPASKMMVPTNDGGTIALFSAADPQSTAWLATVPFQSSGNGQVMVWPFDQVSDVTK